MKQIISHNVKKMVTKSSLVITSLLFSCYLFAQDKKIEVEVNSKSDDGGSFFMQPWVWVVGGAVFLLLLVALLRNNNSKS